MSQHIPVNRSDVVWYTQPCAPVNWKPAKAKLKRKPKCRYLTSPPKKHLRLLGIKLGISKEATPKGPNVESLGVWCLQQGQNQKQTLCGAPLRTKPLSQQEQAESKKLQWIPGIRFVVSPLVDRLSFFKIKGGSRARSTGPLVGPCLVIVLKSGNFCGFCGTTPVEYEESTKGAQQKDQHGGFEQVKSTQGANPSRVRDKQSTFLWVLPATETTFDCEYVPWKQYNIFPEVIDSR